METKVSRLDALTDRTPLALTIDGKAIGVCKVGNKVHAFRNLCPHRRAPLACGRWKEPCFPSIALASLTMAWKVRSCAARGMAGNSALKRARACSARAAPRSRFIP